MTIPPKLEKQLLRRIPHDGLVLIIVRSAKTPGIMSDPMKLRLGIIGAGEVTQVIHMTTRQLLSHLYQVHG